MQAGEKSVRQHGFTYVWALAAVATLSIGLAQVGPIWSNDLQREREAELVRIGALYAQAIARYYELSPGSLKKYPPTLNALLLDERFLSVQRHLRKLYLDPMRPGQALGLLRGDDGGIRGVYSTSQDKPLRREPLDLGALQLPAAERYSDWRFIPKVRGS